MNFHHVSSGDRQRWQCEEKKFQADDKISQEQSNAVTVVIYCWILVKSQKIQSKV